MGKFFKKFFSGKIEPKENLRTCIKNSLKRTNRYKLIKILKNIIRYVYIQTSPRACRDVKIDKVCTVHTLAPCEIDIIQACTKLCLSARGFGGSW